MIAGLREIALVAMRPIAAWLLGVRMRLSGAQVGLALCYHRIAEDEGDPVRELSASVSRRAFEAQLRHLRRRYRVVPASHLAAFVASRSRGQRLPVAITFDDDLASHLSQAAPALKRAGVPATFFLSGASLNGPTSFWWQLLQRAWDRDLVGAALLEAWGIHQRDVSIRSVARRIQAMSPAERDAATAALRSAVGGDTDTETLSRNDLEALASEGFEIGFHTLKHDQLTALNDEELSTAMGAGRVELERIAGPLSVISYPHGQADERVAAAARAAGFRFGFLADGSPVAPGDDARLLGRRYPASGSAASFALDIARILHRRWRSG